MGARSTCLAIILTALLLSLAESASGAFIITYTTAIEEKPAIVFNSVNQEYLVAWRSNVGASGVLVQRVSKTGTLLGGPVTVLVPGVPALATGRPTLAYSPVSNSYVIAINRYYGPTVEDNLLHIGTLDGATLVQTEAYVQFIDSEFHDPSGAFKAGAVRLTYNPIDEEFLVSYQRSIEVDPIFGTKHNFISTQRYQIGLGPVGPEQNPISNGLSYINSHDVEVGTYIQEWYPPDPPVIGARYLVAYGGGGISELGLALLDVYGGFHLDIPFSSGIGGGSGFPAIAYGRLPSMTHAHWMVAWGDSNNLCYDGGHYFVETCVEQEWSGIWGTYLDPWRTSYGPGPDNAVFPISYIASHIESTTPDVAFNDAGDLFYVTWREYPGEDPLNDESRSHIRANAVDYFVTSEPAPVPYANFVASPVTGTCPPAPAGCLSNEDPSYPAVAADNIDGALVVWQQEYPPNPVDTDVFGELLSLPEPGAVLQLASGLLGLAALNRRRHRASH